MHIYMLQFTLFSYTITNVYVCTTMMHTYHTPAQAHKHTSSYDVAVASREKEKNASHFSVITWNYCVAIIEIKNFFTTLGE